MKDIEHVVLVMMENRSFDSMLGWLYEDKRPTHNIPALKPGEREFEGLQGLDPKPYINKDPKSGKTFGPIKGARGLNVPNIAPGESYEEVNTQLHGSARNGKTPSPPIGGEIEDVPGDEKKGPSDDSALKPLVTMLGYVEDYANLMRRHGISEDNVLKYMDQVMQTHVPYQLPVLNGLAEHYAVCDMWFSSIPSQTNPNRAFAFCGTSMGMADNGFLEDHTLLQNEIENAVGYKLGDDRVQAKTVFNALHEDGKTTWKIFRESGLLQNNVHKAVTIFEAGALAGGLAFLALQPIFLALAVAIGMALEPALRYFKELSSTDKQSDYMWRLFPKIREIPDAASHFGDAANLDEFHRLARAGTLPNFTLIQPEWTIGERGTGNASGVARLLFHQGDDYHPPVNLDAGEMLLSQIYESLIVNRKAWEKTLLIITFDEPVGSFDHVKPPKAVAPWAKGAMPRPQQLQHDFEFDRYGGRVPTILVSPLIEKGTVFRSDNGVPFDHTSLIKSILKWRDASDASIDTFGQRTKQAPTFNHIVSRTTPRTDERDIRFLNISHKNFAIVRPYDRFQLRAANGKYVSRFEERAVTPFSVFSDDPSMSEFVPRLTYTTVPVERYQDAQRTTFYCVRSKDRTNQLPLNLAHGQEQEIKLVALEPGLGAYNVLGAWRDAHDCYYFNDYLEGDNDAKQLWKLRRADNKTGPLCFGDKIVLENAFWNQVLAPDGDRVTTWPTPSPESVWTIEPVPAYDAPDWRGGVFPNQKYFLKHVKTDKYVTKAYKWASWWYPTLDDGERVEVNLESGFVIGHFVDGMTTQLRSAHEHQFQDNLYVINGQTDKWAYYVKSPSSDPHAASEHRWVLSLAEDSGYIRTGSTYGSSTGGPASTWRLTRTTGHSSSRPSGTTVPTVTGCSRRPESAFLGKATVAAGERQGAVGAPRTLLPQAYQASSSILVPCTRHTQAPRALLGIRYPRDRGRRSRRRLSVASCGGCGCALASARKCWPSARG